MPAGQPEVSDLYLAIMRLSTTQPAMMRSMDLDETLSAQRDQHGLLRWSIRPADWSVKDHPSRAEGHPSAGGHRQRDDAQMKGRYEEARDQLLQI